MSFFKSFSLRFVRIVYIVENGWKFWSILFKNCSKSKFYWAVSNLFKYYQFKTFETLDVLIKSWICITLRTYAHVLFMLKYFLVRSQMVLFGYVWSCMALRSYAQFLCLLGLEFFPHNILYKKFLDPWSEKRFSLPPLPPPKKHTRNNSPGRIWYSTHIAPQAKDANFKV